MKVTCPSCEHERHDFTIQADGRCSVCHIDEQRVETVIELTMADVRHRRDILLARCDWTQLPDAPAQPAWALVRQELRDITNLTVQEAWEALNEIEADHFG